MAGNPRDGGVSAARTDLREALEEGRIEDVLIEAEARGVSLAERNAVRRVLDSLFGTRRPPMQMSRPRGYEGLAEA